MKGAIDKMETRFWAPSVTSQYIDCPIPYHLDTYRGCQFGCVYCFARDFTEFSRRKSVHKNFEYLIGNDPVKFDAWIKRTLEKDYDYKKANEVAFKDRIPLKIGANSDPFPRVESQQRITHSILKVLEGYDYPVEIQTKNPGILAEYSGDFIDPNWVVAVTIISADNDFVKAIEPYAPSVDERFDAIKSLTSSGKKVIVKCQPSIYPRIITDLPKLVERIAESGAFAMNMEGLKITAFASKKEFALYSAMSNALGYDVIEYYRKNGVRKNPTAWEIGDAKQKEYLELGVELAHAHGIKFFCADDDMGRIGDGDECCGTEVLRDYTKWCNNRRTMAFNSCTACSMNFGSCIVTNESVRNKRNVGKTFDEVVNELIEKNKTLQEKLF